MFKRKKKASPKEPRWQVYQRTMWAAEDAYRMQQYGLLGLIRIPEKPRMMRLADAFATQVCWPDGEVEVVTDREMLDFELKVRG